MNTTRALLVDGQVLVRVGIRSLLENMTGIEVVAEAGDGAKPSNDPKQLPDVGLRFFLMVPAHMRC